MTTGSQGRRQQYQAHQSAIDRVSRPGSRISGRIQAPPTVDKSSGGILVPIDGQRSPVYSSRSLRTQSSEDIKIGVESTSDIGPSSTLEYVASKTKRSGYSIPEAQDSQKSLASADRLRNRGNIAFPGGHLPPGVDKIAVPPLSQIFAVDTHYMEWSRYNNRPTVEKKSPEFELRRMEFKYNSVAHDMEGWETYVHPEGDRYFYHPTRKIYTRTNLYDPKLFDHIQHYTYQLDLVKQSEPNMPKDAEYVVMLDVANSDSDPPSGPEAREWDCLYYFVHDSQRLLFWVSECAPTNMRDIVDGVTDPAHIRYAVEKHYWKHVELYPEPRELDPQLLKECIGLLAHAGYDTLTSLISTAPYNTNQLQQQLTFIKNLKNADNVGGYSMCVLGRTMSTFTNEKYINFAGQPCARLSHTQAVYNTEARRRSALINIFSPLLFLAPEVHLRGLEKIWVDEVMWEVPWKAFVQKLQGEWTEFILYSTVLLAVNTAVLAIPTVDNGFQSYRSPVQIFCYVSILCSVATIILGLLVSRQYRASNRETAQDALAHLKAHSSGLETLSIIYSLPYAGLMWSVVTFFGALSSLYFMGTTWPSRVVVSIVEVFIVGLIIWCVIIGSKQDERWWFHQQMDKLRHKWTSGMEKLNVREVFRKPRTTEKSMANSEAIDMDEPRVEPPDSV